jgi:hypothetical protein
VKTFLLKLWRVLMSDTLFLLLVGFVTIKLVIGFAFAIGEIRPSFVISWEHFYTLALTIVLYFYAGVLFARRKGVKRG